MRMLKYLIKMHGETRIELNGIGRVLHVDVQRQLPCVWVEVTHQHPLYKETKKIRVFHTGEEIPNELLHKTKYIGTLLLDDGNYVGHVYQIIE